MDNVWEIVLPVDPATLPTAQQKGERICKDSGGKSFIHHYVKSKISNAQERLLAVIKEAMEGQRLSDDHNGVWFLQTEFVYKPKEVYTKKRLLGTFKITRPDGDNLLKLLMDVLTKSKFFWADDRQVQVDGIFRTYVKTLNDEPCVKLTIVKQI